MSHEAVDAMHRAIGLWNEDERDAYLAHIEDFIGPDFEWHPAMAQLVEGEQRVYRGMDGMRRFWEDSHLLFDLRFEETEIRDLGDRLVVLSQVSVTGRGSGIDLQAPLAMLVRYDDDGRLNLIRQYLSHAEALEAAKAHE